MGKRYKLIKEYPGSLPLNTEVEFLANRALVGTSVLDTSGYYRSDNSQWVTASRRLIEENPEFWQEVIPEPTITLSDLKDILTDLSNKGTICPSQVSDISYTAEKRANYYFCYN